MDIDAISLEVQIQAPSEEISVITSKSGNYIPLAIGISAGVVVLTVFFIVILIIRKNKRQKPIIDEVELASPFLISQVDVHEIVGEGNFGVVYKGVAFGTVVALKYMRAEESEIVAETDMLTRVHHVHFSLTELTQQPNCVRFYGIFKEKTKIYLVTEFCSQGSLLSLLKQKHFTNNELVKMFAILKEV